MTQATRPAGSDPSPLPVGTVTFLFTDIEGSTGLVRRLGAGYAPLLERHNQLIREAVRREGGSEFGTEGDAIFAVFPDAVPALRAAVEAQRRLADEPWPEPVRVRMGLHTGEGRLGGGSYVGLDVHRAARVAAAGHGGQLLMSETTARLVEDHLPQGVRVRSLGRHRLRGLERSEVIYQVDVEGLGTAFPALRAQPEQHLPTPTTSLVGRETDLAAVLALVLRDDTRLVTITGPGGTGKTRLVTELLPLLQDRFPAGIRYVDLSGLTDWKRALPAVGHSLGVLEADGRDLIRAATGLVGESRLLVVVDNMEQVIDAAADLAALIAATAHLKMLVTSREPLRVRGEFEYPLNPLPVPGRDTASDQVATIASVALFVERAQAVAPGFELTAANAATVAEVVRRLDGLPLAIELAAPKLRVLSPESLLERLEDRLDLLQGGGRDMPQRHQALRTAVAWSYDLLDDDTRRLFRRLGVFAGGFTLEAAEAVCRATGSEPRGLLDELGDLVAKSMVTFYLDDGGRPRYRLLDTLRAYALEQLAVTGEEEDIRTGHLRWCAGFVEECEALYTSARFPEALDLIEQERHNVRSALEWSLGDPARVEQGLGIAGMLWIFWDVRGFATEGLAWLRRLLTAPGSRRPTRGRALALDAAGWLERLTSGTADPDADFTEAEGIWAELGDTRMRAWSLGMHGMITYNSYDPERAREQFEESARLAREAGDEPLAEIWCNFGLAHALWMTGAMDVAEELLGRSLQFSRKWNHVWATAHAQFSHGILDFLKGDLAGAGERLRESLTLRNEMRDIRGIADCLGALAILSGAGGDPETAAVLLGAADAQREAAGQVPVPWLQPFFDQITETSRDALGEPAFEAALTRGRATSRGEAVSLALGGTMAATDPAI